MSGSGGDGQRPGIFDRSAGFWTMVGGVCAVIGIVITVLLTVVHQNTPSTDTSHSSVDQKDPVDPPDSPTPTPTPVAPWKWTTSGANPYACSYEGTLRSVSGGTAAQVEVDNRRSDQNIQLDWIDYNGNRQQVATVESDSSYRGMSATGQAFMISDYTAKCVELFTVSSTATNVLVVIS